MFALVLPEVCSDGPIISRHILDFLTEIGLEAIPLPQSDFNTWTEVDNTDRGEDWCGSGAEVDIFMATTAVFGASNAVVFSKPGDGEFLKFCKYAAGMKDKTLRTELPLPSKISLEIIEEFPAR